MLFPSDGPQSCKDAIVNVLSGSSSLSAKRIHKLVKERSCLPVSYQAIHKALQSLADTKVVKRFEQEYYLNEEWIEYLYSFAQQLKEKKAIAPQVKGQSPVSDFTQAFRIQAIRFVPFSLGPFPPLLPPSIQVKERTEERITFNWKGRMYVWYVTGVCVQVDEEEERQHDAVSFLVERRTIHRDILEAKHEYTKDIHKLVQLVNSTVLPKLSYVMSIHHISSHDSPAIPLLVHPSILGIPDNPKVIVNEEQIRQAQQHLAQLHGFQSPDTYELSCNDAKVFASWSNVMFSGNLSSQLIPLQCDLQHLWYYWYILKNNLRRNLRKGNIKEIKRILRQKKRCISLWHEFGDLGAMDDTLTLLLKEALIKTSRIEKIYGELQQLFLHAEKVIPA